MSAFAERARRDLLSIYSAALAAADPRAAVARALRRDRDTLHLGERAYDLRALGGVHVLAAGKAAATMARGAADALGDAIRGGVLVTSRGSAAGAPLPVIEAGHPVPDESSVRGGQALLDAAREGAAAGRLVLVLLSGGASALAEVPAPPLTLSDMQATTQLLLRSGAAIGEINVVRKHLSAFKGGQLARAAAPAPTATLVLSDVVGSPLDAIGSGPTVADTSSWADVSRVLEAYQLLEAVPAAVRARVLEGLSGRIPDTPKPGDPVLASGQVQIVGDAAMAAEAARAEAQRLGYNAHVVTASVQGDAELFARALPEQVERLRHGKGPVRVPACLVFAGETTVIVRGAGRGGRNQQLALTFASLCEGQDDVALAAVATDGIDGPTDAAGAIVDGSTATLARAAGIPADAALTDNDAYRALQAAGALVQPGPTGTNVNDLLLLLVQ